jgi:hypothetical protein
MKFETWVSKPKHADGGVEKIKKRKKRGEAKMGWDEMPELPQAHKGYKEQRENGGKQEHGGISRLDVPRYSPRS